MDGDPPAHAIDWRATTGPRVRHQGVTPERRFTAPHAEPRLDPRLGRPKGVPISAFILRRQRRSARSRSSSGASTGRRRAHGGADGIGDDGRGLRAAGRRPPRSLSMLPFAGYHVGSYINHWLSFGRHIPDHSHLLRGQLVPAATTTAGSSGQASVRTCASSSGSSTARAAASASRVHSGWMPRYRDLNWKGARRLLREARFRDPVGRPRRSGTPNCSTSRSCS